MKAKLLKKLRKEAKAYYWVEYFSRLHDGRFVVRSIEHAKHCYIAKTETKNITEAKRHCDTKRRDYILEHLHRLEEQRDDYKVNY